jgi:hypothetical protein
MSLQSTLFGPLAKDYCSLFLFLSIVGLIYILLAVFAAISLFFSKKGKPEYFAHLITFLAVGIVIYLQNRLLYNICLR